MAYKLFVNGDTLPASDLNNAFGTSGWTAFTPTLASGTFTPGTGGTLTGYYMQIGKTVWFRINGVLGGTGRSVSDPNFNVPVTASANVTDYAIIGQAFNRATGVHYMGAIRFLSGSFRPLMSAGGAGGSLSALSGTTPAPIASGDYYSFIGTYEAA